MIQDRLLIKFNKTEFVIIGTRRKLCKLQAMNIEVGSSDIKPSSQVKNLGCLDSNLCMSDHITNVCKAAFFYVHNIRRIKKYRTNFPLSVQKQICRVYFPTFYGRHFENLLDIFVKTFSPGNKDNDLPLTFITVLCKRNEFKLSFQRKKEQNFAKI